MVLPIAGIILTFIACYELIEMITQHNNMAQMCIRDRLLVYDVICAPQASLFVALPAAHDISGFFEFLYRFADCPFP